MAFLTTNIDECSQQLVVQGFAAVAHPVLDSPVDVVYRILVCKGKATT